MSIDKLVASLAASAKRRPLTMTPLIMWVAIVGVEIGPGTIPDAIFHELFFGTLGYAAWSSVKDSVDRWVRARYGKKTTVDTSEVDEIRDAGGP